MERIKLHLHMGDYFRDTTHLNATGHGAYFLLICHYYTHGRLPEDDDQIRQVAKLDRQRWQKYRPTLQAFFRVENGQWKHKRIEAEIEAARKVSEVKRANAMARYGGNGPNPLTNNERTSASAAQPSSFFQKEFKSYSSEERKAPRAREPEPTPEDRAWLEETIRIQAERKARKP